MTEARRSHAGFTFVEIVVATCLLGLFILSITQFFLQGKQEANFMVEKITSRDENKVAFRMMCGELREARRILVKCGDSFYQPTENKYLLEPGETTDTAESLPFTNSIVFQNFDGDIIAYYACDKQLKRQNFTQLVEHPETRPKVVARMVVEQKDQPSIFRVSPYNPGKRAASVLIKLTLGTPGRRNYTLVSSVFLRNIARFKE